jgi:hypothetical protein
MMMMVMVSAFYDAGRAGGPSRFLFVAHPTPQQKQDRQDRDDSQRRNQPSDGRRRRSVQLSVQSRKRLKSVTRM